ncbi:unnamed protein product [Ectocarpus sp. 13 AM-2016]
MGCSTDSAWRAPWHGCFSWIRCQQHQDGWGTRKLRREFASSSKKKTISVSNTLSARAETQGQTLSTPDSSSMNPADSRRCCHPGVCTVTARDVLGAGCCCCCCRWCWGFVDREDGVTVSVVRRE